MSDRAAQTPAGPRLRGLRPLGVRRPQRRRARRLSAVGAGLGAVLLLTACGPQDAEGPSQEPTGEPVIVGAGPTEQTEAVAQVWLLQLEQAGIPAEIRDLDGGRAAYLEALRTHELDLYPDTTGELYLELRDDQQPGSAGTASAGTGSAAATAAPTGASGSADPSASASPSSGAEDTGLVDSLAALLGQDTVRVTDEAVEEAILEELPEGTTILPGIAAQSSRALAVTAATAAQLPGGSIEDLTESCPELAVGAIGGEQQEPVTTAALSEAYGCEPRAIRSYATQEEAVQALLEDEVQVASIRTTSPAISDHALTVLEDPQDALVPERMVPVIDEGLPQPARDAVQEISGEIDTEALVLMTRMTTSSTPYTPFEAAEYWWEDARDESP